MMPDDGDDPTHTLYEDYEPPWFDKLLKRLMRNGTVMRRWIAAAMIGGVLFGTVAIAVINRVSGNTIRSEKAICAVIAYAEGQADRIDANPDATPGAAANLRKLGRDMRKTGIHDCPPYLPGSLID